VIPQLFVAFLTGLTAGGIGCLAVQSGLLAGSLARRFEGCAEVEGVVGPAETGAAAEPRFAVTIALFLLAKLAAYTGTGFLLGAFGSLVRITPLSRAALTILIGTFLVGNGLRMLGVHPVFRWFVLEPPSSLRRFIRRASGRTVSPVAPVFLGTLTVLLPCGVSQAMMAAAVGTGDPFLGAALLFAFTLGTIPIFFSVAYFATRLSAAVQAHFNRFVALILLGFGGVSVYYGLNLAGIPFGLSYSDHGPAEQSGFSNPPGPSETGTNGKGEYVISVSNGGYEPKVLHLPANRPVTLIWVTRDGTSCTRSVVLPGLKYHAILPSSGRSPLTIPPQKLGTRLPYCCSTGRFTGLLVFDGKEEGTDPSPEGTRP